MPTGILHPANNVDALPPKPSSRGGEVGKMREVDSEVPRSGPYSPNAEIKARHDAKDQ